MLKYRPKKLSIIIAGLVGCVSFTTYATSPLTKNIIQYNIHSTLSEEYIAEHLGWVPVPDDRCGGYYIDPAFPASALREDDHIAITGNQLLYAQKGTSLGRGKVTITRKAQQIIANKVWLYRNPKTQKLSAIKIADDVVLREPDNIIMAKTGYLDLTTHQETLHHLFYRTTFHLNNKNNQTLPTYSAEQLSKPRQVSGATAFGQAESYRKIAPNVYELYNASYSTCPPLTHPWHVSAYHLLLDKNTGRGTATHARIYIRNVPVFYAPYLSFPIDSRRQTGFLTPVIGTSSKTGFRLSAPFYWNMAPNYDMTITPTLMTKRGIQITDRYRYLTEKSQSNLDLEILPSDLAFKEFQRAMAGQYQNNTNATTQAELRRLQNASPTRYAISYNDDTHYNAHWQSHINYNHVSDDYYMHDFSTSINEITQNQLDQEATLNYSDIHWQFTGQIQGYQTLHPIDEAAVDNQYYRLPRLSVNGSYPETVGGMNLFMGGELTHFTIKHNPGDSSTQPIGNRLNLQPGIERPFYNAWSYLTPRLQFALTQYDLSDTNPGQSNRTTRALPIFDLHSGVYFDRDLTIGNTDWQQTLEPQIYYTYVPFRKQSQIPLFDTSLNTLTYDQLFSYTRFSGIDRIGDANQISYGVITRFIDPISGTERFRAGLGQIYYFHKREVTLTGEPTPEDKYDKSPVAGQLVWHINNAWNLQADSIWSVQYNNFTNQHITLSFIPETNKIVNLSYGFVRNGDILPNDPPDTPASNLSQTDLSFAWPLSSRWSAVGRWTQNWNHHHFQNILYGLQYDTCCWAVRFVAQRAFTGLSSSNTYMYDSGLLVQVALKGLGNFGNGDPDSILTSSIPGYHAAFGQIT
ncbi:MAG: LPS-assembly protein LptD [Gammaproteobacteria bacterium]|nr:LPS-assembly protein LptD [Gammaproteobacteria bacterium]